MFKMERSNHSRSPGKIECKGAAAGKTAGLRQERMRGMKKQGYIAVFLVMILVLGEPLSAAAFAPAEGKAGAVCSSTPGALNAVSDQEKEDNSQEEQKPLEEKSFYLDENKRVQKKQLKELHLAEAVFQMIPGEDYADSQVYFTAESQKEAEQIADLYNAELVSYEDKVAVLKTEKPVPEMLRLAEEQENDYPAVYPNFYYTLATGSAVEMKAELSEQELSRKLEQAVSNNSLYGAMWLPNDPLLGEQWHHDMVYDYAAWNTAKGENVLVAVIDSGINRTHPDLKKNIKAAVNKCSFAQNGAEDNSGHGTHVAGIIAAVADNGIGVAGVAPAAKLLAIKAGDYIKGKVGFASADIVKSINYAVSQGADVINMSLGGPSKDVPVQNAITNAADHGVVVVAAAGNAAYDMANGVKEYPACCEDVITVSSVTRSGELSYFSNYGKGIINVAAPGGSALEDYTLDIFSCYLNNAYAYMPGTSMASPVAAGTAALILSADSALRKSKNRTRAEAVANIICDKASPAGASQYFGSGIVNSAESLSLVQQSLEAPVLSIETNSKVKSGTVLQLSSNIPGAAFYYTTNGKQPTMSSERSYGSLVLNGTGNKTVKVIAAHYGRISPAATARYSLYSPVQSISIVSRNGETGVAVKKSLNLSAEVFPAEATNKKVIWSSDNTLVAEVKNGKVTGKTPGTAVITAKAADGSEVTETIAVTVYPAVTALALSQSSLELAVLGVSGLPESSELTVLCEPEHAMKRYKVTSSNERAASAVCKSDGRIEVTAVGSGSTTIKVTALDGTNKSVSCKVKVIKPARVLAIKSNTGLYGVARGKSLKLTAVQEDGATNKKLVWSSSNEAVLKVNQNGTVSAKGTGTATVTAVPADGCSAGAAAEVKVYEATSSIQLAKREAVLYVPGASQTVQISVSPNPAQGTMGQYLFQSKNPKVAAVSETGLVRGIGKGKTQIIVKAADGTNKTAVFKVSVIKPVTRLQIYNQEAVALNKSVKLKTIITPADASNQKLNWISSDPAVVSVDKNGKITGKRAGGSAVIQAVAADGSGATQSMKVTVYNAAKFLSFDNKKVQKSKSISIPAGYYTQVPVYIGPSGCYKSVSVTSSNPSVARFQNGNIYAISKGTATITYKTVDGTNKKAALKIKVT